MNKRSSFLKLSMADNGATRLASPLALGVVLLLSGCGTDPGDRMLSGGMLGAAGGAIVGAATGDPGAGAAIGAAGGAFIGGVTNPCQLDLGAPYWKRHGGRKAYEKRCGHNEDRDGPRG